jgi:hypothetical protein
MSAIRIALKRAHAQSITNCQMWRKWSFKMNNFERDWKHSQTKHDDLDAKTMFVSVGLFACFVMFLLIGGAYL